MKGIIHMRKMIDRQLLLSKADILSVAEKLGVRIGKMTGKRVQILCPEHDDRHFGSCILDLPRQRYHCFACNASGNAIDLIMACNHWARDDGQKAYEAMKILADLSGLDLHACEKDIDISVVEMPSKEELDLIGLSDSPAFCMDQEDPSRRVLVSSHPLRDFAREDYRSFKIMVCDKILEAEANLISLRNVAEKYDCCDMIQTLICQIDEQLSTLQKMKLRYTA